MGSMKDLLGDTFAKPAYPQSPGWKGLRTSRAAARNIGNSAEGMRADVLAEIAAAGRDGLTADEVATRLGRTVLAIRPRVSELGKQGKIVATERTRKNDSGRPAAVWIAKGFEP